MRNTKALGMGDQENSLSAKQFRENLPEGCPPLNATQISYPDGLYRLCRDTPPKEGDFDSHQKLGKCCPPGVSPCKWRSCSMFDPKVANLKSLTKLTGLRKMKYLLRVAISESDGLGHVKKSGHVDFWAYEDFNFCNAVLNVEPVK